MEIPRTCTRRIPRFVPGHIFVVIRIKTEGDLEHLEDAIAMSNSSSSLNYIGGRISVRGIYLSEQKAYLSAIQNLLYDLEECAGCRLPWRRAVASARFLTLPDRLAGIHACHPPLLYRFNFCVRSTLLYPEVDLLPMINALAYQCQRIFPGHYWDEDQDDAKNDQNYRPSVRYYQDKVDEEEEDDYEEEEEDYYDDDDYDDDEDADDDDEEKEDGGEKRTKDDMET